MRKSILIIFCVIFISLLSLTSSFVLTYKTKYLNIVKENVNLTNNEQIKASLVMAIIKNESKFDKNAKSSKNAIGLMQLTTSTAFEIAQKNDISFSVENLTNENMNIKLGVLYLDYLFDMFNDKNLVILSYNAGPFRVKEWIQNNKIYENGKVNTPFKETNAYLNKVLRDENIYKKLIKEHK